MLFACLVLAWIPALACNMTPAENPAIASDLAWSVKADFDSTRVSNSCNDAIVQILRRFDVRRDLRLSLEAFAPAWGSVSLGLAKISAVAMQIQQAIRNKGNRHSIPIEIRLLPASVEPSKPSDSRHFILRLHQNTR